MYVGREVLFFWLNDIVTTFATTWRLMISPDLSVDTTQKEHLKEIDGF